MNNLQTNKTEYHEKQTNNLWFSFFFNLFICYAQQVPVKEKKIGDNGTPTPLSHSFIV